MIITNPIPQTIVTTVRSAGGFSIGDKNADGITNLTPSFSITATQITGPAPLAVFFEAHSPQNFVAVNNPFHQIWVDWDFDDAGAVYENIAVDSFFGDDANRAYGKYTAHVFEQPGTYTIVARARNLIGQAAFQTIVITVDDPNSTFAGGNTAVYSEEAVYTGAPSGALTFSTLLEARNFLADTGSKRLLLRRGETFTDAFDLNASAGLKHIGDYGVGEKPILATTDLDASVVGSGGSASMMVYNLAIRGPHLAAAGGSFGTGAGIALGGIGDNVAAYRCDVQGMPKTIFVGPSAELSEGTICQGGMIIDCYVSNWCDYGSYIAPGRSHLAYLGNFIQQPADIVRVSGTGHGPIRFTEGAKVVVSRNNLRSRSGHAGDDWQPSLRFPAHRAGRSIIVNENEMTDGLVVITFGPEASTVEAALGEQMCERNLLRKIDDPFGGDFINCGFMNTTVRNNLCLGDSSRVDGQANLLSYGHDTSNTDNSNAPLYLYNNTLIDLSTSQWEYFGINHSQGWPGLVQAGNVIYVPNAPNGSSFPDPGLDANHRPLPGSYAIPDPAEAIVVLDTIDGENRSTQTYGAFNPAN